MNNNIIIRNDKGEVIVNPEVGTLLNDILTEKEKLMQKELELKHSILTAMKENDIQTADVDGFKFSQVVPKPLSKFDTDAFLLNENEEILSAFITISEEKLFNIEKFKSEQAEMYERYSETYQNVDVNTKKLCKTLPAIYNKYYSETPSDKEITLRVTKK